MPQPNVIRATGGNPESFGDNHDGKPHCGPRAGSSASCRPGVDRCEDDTKKSVLRSHLAGHMKVYRAAELLADLINSTRRKRSADQSSSIATARTDYHSPFTDLFPRFNAFQGRSIAHHRLPVFQITGEQVKLCVPTSPQRLAFNWRKDDRCDPDCGHG